jgi:hypothetical protein
MKKAIIMKVFTLVFLSLILSCGVSENVSKNSPAAQSIPTISIISPSSGMVTNVMEITINGISGVVLPATITEVLVKLNTNTWQSAAGTETWSADLSLIEGTNIISAIAVSSQGKTNAVTNHIVIVNLSLPIISVTYPADNLVTNMESVSLSGTASVTWPETISVIKIQLNSGMWQDADGTNSWSISLLLDEGTNTYSMMAITGHDKTNTLMDRKIVVQYATPSLSIIAPVNNFYTNISGITVFGTAGIGAPETIQMVKVKLNSGVWQIASGTNNWSYGLTLIANTNKISVLAISSHLKTNSILDNIAVYDNVKPTLTVSNPITNIMILSNHYRIAGTASDNYGVKAVYISINGSAFSNASGTLNWSKDLTLKEGYHVINTIKVFSIDNSGNYSLTNTKTITLNNKFWDAGMGMISFDAQFGCSVAVTSSDTFIVAGARYNSHFKANAGSYEIIQWARGVLGAGSDLWNGFASPDDAINDYYGSSVAISYANVASKYYIIVGSPFDDDKGVDSGSVYVYTNQSMKMSKITASDGTAGDMFGISVACSTNGKTIAVGSPYHDLVAADAGNVYIFKWDGTMWLQYTRIYSSAAAGQNYGRDVGISANGNIVISPIQNKIIVNKWNGSSWVESVITSSAPYLYAVAISADGNTIAGTVKSVANPPTPGHVYIYNWSGSVWNSSLLTSPVSDGEDAYGCDVAISADGNIIVVGASDDDVKGINSGAIYKYKWNGSSWDYTKNYAYNATAGTYFGGAVSISLDGKTIVVGSPNDNNGNIGHTWGSVWVIKE